MDQKDENPEDPPFLFKIYVQESHQNLEAICDILGENIILLDYNKPDIIYLIFYCLLYHNYHRLRRNVKKE